MIRSRAWHVIKPLLSITESQQFICIMIAVSRVFTVYTNILNYDNVHVLGW